MGVAVALSAAQTFEEALWGPGGPGAAYADGADDDLPDPPWDDPWKDLSPDPGDDPGGDLVLLGDPPPVVWVVHPTLGEDYLGNPHPGSAPALCPLVKPPHPPGYPNDPNVHDEGTELTADAAPMGGTYRWRFGRQDTRASTWYECDSLEGAYLERQVKVGYEVEGQTAPDATSGYIRVFNAELTFEGGSIGPQNSVEDDPGFFMAPGPTRKALALTLTPPDPDDVMPTGFREGMTPRYGPAPYVVSLDATGPVSFYADAEGGTPLTDLVWGWKEGEYGVLTEVNAPQQVYVQATGTGEATITLSLDINCPQECLGWYAAPAFAEDEVKVTVPDVDLDIYNVIEDSEEYPGGFIGKKSSRKKIMLTAAPENVRPVTLSVTAGADKVEIYDEPTGGYVLTGDSLVFESGEDVPHELWVRGIEASDHPQDVELTLDAAPPGGEHFTDKVNLTVVGVNLRVAAVGEEYEFDPGVFIQHNTDDDEPNGEADILDTPSVNENDLATMMLFVSPSDLDGEVRLLGLTGKFRVKVWPDETKTGAEISLPGPVWTPATMPNQLYLEGYAASAGVRDVGLELSYTGHGLSMVDDVRGTVVSVDLTVEGVPDGEETYPGGSVCLNDDDDNGNGIPDNGQFEGSPVEDENDLVAVTVHKVLPEDLTGTVTLTAPAGSGKVKFWADPTKGTELGPEQLTWTTPAQLLQDTTVYVEGFDKSGSPRDVELMAQFTGTDPDVTFADKVKMTSFVVQLEPITVEADSGVLYNPCGVELHGTAQYKVHVEPAMGEDEVVWHILDGYVGFVGWNAAPICTIMGDVLGDAKLGVEIAGFRQAMPTVELTVLDKKEVHVSVYIICLGFDGQENPVGAATDEARVVDMLTQANRIFTQVGMGFGPLPPEGGLDVEYIDNWQYMNLTNEGNWRLYDEMCDYESDTHGLEVYFVDSLKQDGNDISGLTSQARVGTAIADRCTATALAHELGHCTGLHDIYSSQGQEFLGTELVQEGWEPSDWSNGADCWYYHSRYRQGELVHRLLMYGNDQETAVDIAKGRVYGVCVDDDENVYKGMQKVGLGDMDRTPEHD